MVVVLAFKLFAAHEGGHYVGSGIRQRLQLCYSLTDRNPLGHSKAGDFNFAVMVQNIFRANIAVKIS